MLARHHPPGRNGGMKYFKRSVVAQRSRIVSRWSRGRQCDSGGGARRRNEGRCALRPNGRLTRDRQAQTEAAEQDITRCAAYTVTLKTYGLAVLNHGRPTTLNFERAQLVNYPYKPS